MHAQIGSHSCNPSGLCSRPCASNVKHALSHDLRNTMTHSSATTPTESAPSAVFQIDTKCIALGSALCLHAAAAERHKAELAAAKRDFKGRLDTAKREGRQPLKHHGATVGGEHLQHQLDVKTAEARVTHFIFLCRAALLIYISGSSVTHSRVSQWFPHR